MKKQKSICVLSRVFSTLLISLSLFFVSAQWVTLLAQQKTQVTGKVSDSTGEPVIGASVIQKGTSIGTITDIEGNFSLSVSSGSTLQISYIGYVSQEIKAVSGRNLTIKLNVLLPIPLTEIQLNKDAKLEQNQGY